MFVVPAVGMEDALRIVPSSRNPARVATIQEAVQSEGVESPPADGPGRFGDSPVPQGGGEQPVDELCAAGREVEVEGRGRRDRSVRPLRWSPWP